MFFEIEIFRQNINLLEIAAMLTGIAGVWLTLRQNIWCFPVGIINVALYAWLFSTPGVRLFADALLQVSYIILLTYGWINWKKVRKSQNNFNPVRISPQLSRKLFVLFIVSSVALGIFFSQFTDASLPWLDSSLTCASLIAQWMIAKKYIENWIVWIAVNIIYIPMYYYKELPLTAILYTLFLLLAIRGLYEWKKKISHAE
jgi:nicotinamide mononucleotide transporter